MNKTKLRLTNEQREKILRNLWLLHDGRWFLKAIGEFGFDTATKLNLTVIKSFGKTEIKQLLAETGVGKISNIKNFKTIMEFAADLLFPKDHKYEFKILDRNTFLGRVLECYVYKNVSKAGITAIHQCAAKTRFDSWLEAFDLQGEITVDKNTYNCSGSCDIIFRIEWEEKEAGAARNQ